MIAFIEQAILLSRQEVGKKDVSPERPRRRYVSCAPKILQCASNEESHETSLSRRKGLVFIGPTTPTDRLIIHCVTIRSHNHCRRRHFTCVALGRRNSSQVSWALIPISSSISLSTRISFVSYVMRYRKYQ